MSATRRRNREQTTEDGQRLYPACQDCGAAVTDPYAKLETIESEGYTELVGKQKIEMVRDQPREVTVSRCRECEVRVKRAADLADAHPRAMEHLRHLPNRVHVIDGALIVFDMLGFSWRALVDEASDARVHRTVESLMYAGGSARYLMNLRPVLLPGFGRGVTIGTERWAHTTEEQRQRVRDAYGAHLADLVDGPLAVPVPAAGYGRPAMSGCMLCGVGTLVVPSRQSRAHGVRCGASRPRLWADRASPSRATAMCARPAPRR